VGKIDTYTEKSPSGTGLHLLAKGTLPEGRRRTGCVELYDRGRFFTVTGDHVPGTPRTLHERTREVGALHKRLFPENRVFSSPRGGDGQGFGREPILSERVKRALRSDPQLRRRFQRIATGLTDTSGSAIDFSLAARLHMHRISDREGIDALRLSRSRDPVNPKKAQRLDYIVATWERSRE
jgi:primase-polymerase (primpol)-like protein